MDPTVLTSFVDELSKMAAMSNVMGPKVLSMGKNVMGRSTPTVGVKSLTRTAAKPTNSSMVHNQAPSAAYGAASTTSKAVPPPPVT